MRAFFIFSDDVAATADVFSEVRRAIMLKDLLVQLMAAQRSRRCSRSNVNAHWRGPKPRLEFSKPKPGMQELY
jgi:hypothetical protein